MRAEACSKLDSGGSLTHSSGDLTAVSSFFIYKNLHWSCHRSEDFAPACFFSLICFGSSQASLLNPRCFQYLYVFLIFHIRASISCAFSRLNPEDVSIKIYNSIERFYNIDHNSPLPMPMASRTSCPIISKICACSRHRRSRSRSTDPMFVSRTKGVSICSNCPESSQFSTVFSKGSLYVLSEGGIPYFMFSVTNGEDYIAIPRKVNSAIESVHGYIFLFRTVPNSGRNLCDMVGVIKVSSHTVSDSNITKHTESDFILYDTRNIRPVGTESSTITPRKTRAFPRTPLSTHSKTAKKSSECQSIGYQTFLKHCIDELKQFKGDLAYFLAKHLHPSLESAAAVIQDYRFDEEKMSRGGWGLKFLGKHVDARAKLSDDFRIPLESCIAGERGSARRIDAVIPFGLHCFQEDGTAMPSSLTERWKSGRCDCGGWDIGCPFYLLKSWAADRKAFPGEALREDSRVVNLVKEGFRNSQTSMSIETIGENLHVVYFLQSLSSIQSFWIGLSVIHSQISSECPYL